MNISSVIAAFCFEIVIVSPDTVHYRNVDAVLNILFGNKISPV